MPKYTRNEVRVLKELIEATEYRAVIDRIYRLEDVVGAAACPHARRGGDPAATRP